MAHRENHYHQFGVRIRYFSLKSLKALGRCPRYPDDEGRIAYEELSPNLYENNVIIFVSHKWLSRDHPDDNPAGGNKYRLMVEGIEATIKAYAPGFDENCCYIWFDYGCLNQNDCPAAELQSLDRIVRSSDIIFTPHYDDKNAFPTTFKSLYEGYKSPMWNGDLVHAYLNRPWCRVEMMYSTHISILKPEGNKRSRFVKAIQEIHGLDRRPHVLYVLKEKIPNILHPLIGKFEKAFDPRSVIDNLSYPTDRYKIERLMSEVNLPRKKIIVGYTGEKDAEGRRHGKGRMIYPDGGVYEGDWKNGVMEGKGKYIFTYGDIYEGDFRNNVIEGTGKYIYGNGEIYEGDYKNNVMEGKGKFISANGDIYEGGYKNGRFDGHGKTTFKNGDIYEGSFKQDMEHGQGRLSDRNGRIIYDGLWNMGKRQPNQRR